MRDVGGFFLLVLIVFALLYFSIRFALPLMLIYAGGLLAFTVIAAVIIAKGRVRRVHFRSLLLPGYAGALALCAIVIPAVHLSMLWLIGRRDGLPALAAFNWAPPLIFAVWILLAGRAQKKEYYNAGHDIEERLEECLSRAGLLDLKIEIMTTAADTEEHPEPWEIDAGIARPAGEGLRGRIIQAILEMKQLRDEYRRLAGRFEVPLEAIRKAKRRGSDIDTTDLQAAYMELDNAWSELSRDTKLILDEKVGYTYREWEQTA